MPHRATLNNIASSPLGLCGGDNSLPTDYVIQWEEPGWQDFWRQAMADPDLQELALHREPQRVTVNMPLLFSKFPPEQTLLMFLASGLKSHRMRGFITAAVGEQRNGGHCYQCHDSTQRVFLECKVLGGTWSGFCSNCFIRDALDCQPCTRDHSTPVLRQTELVGRSPAGCSGHALSPAPSGNPSAQQAVTREVKEVKEVKEEKTAENGWA